MKQRRYDRCPTFSGSSYESRATGERKAARETAAASRTACANTVLVVTTFAALLRLWALGSWPLIIQNDSVGYLNWATDLAVGGTFDAIPPVRTPGYPLFLAGVFKVFGAGPVGILLAQHALGCLTCALVTFVACRFVGPRWGVLPGILCALDPLLLAVGSFALSEQLTVTVVAVAAAIALTARKPRFYVAFALGLVLGAACMVRPALQVIVPLFALGWLLNSYRGWKPALLGLLFGALGVGLPTAPWVRFNHQRGVQGIASGYSVMQFRGLFVFGLLDRNFPQDEETRALLAEFEGRNPTWGESGTFVQKVGGWRANADLFAEWNRASIRRNRWAFVRHCCYTLCWQMNYHPKGAPDPQRTWMRNVLHHMGRVEDSDLHAGEPEERGVELFTMTSRPGPLCRIYAWLAPHVKGGIPHMPIFILGVLGVPLGLARREWGLALVLVGTLAFVIAHTLTLHPFARYVMPMWPVWYAAVVITPMLLVDLVKSFLRNRARRAVGSQASQSTA